MVTKAHVQYIGFCMPFLVPRELWEDLSMVLYLDCNVLDEVNSIIVALGGFPKMAHFMARQNQRYYDNVPPAPRITSNVKQNLQLIRLSKELQKRKYDTPKPPTRYRRKKVEKEVEKEEISEETELDPDLTFYDTDQGTETSTPVLLVDGYNVCGYWEKLKTHFLSGRLEIARQYLLDELLAFSMLREVKVVVVFDAVNSGIPTHRENFFGIDVVYARETSDTWIEKEVVALMEDGCPKVWVATSDVLQQEAVNWAGAFVWSCKALVSEIKASQREERMTRDYSSTSMQGRLLKHNLDPQVVAALKDLRDKLK